MPGFMPGIDVLTIAQIQWRGWPEQVRPWQRRVDPARQSARCADRRAGRV